MWESRRYPGNSSNSSDWVLSLESANFRCHIKKYRTMITEYSGMWTSKLYWKWKYVMEVFSKIETIGRFTNGIVTLLKVILSIRILILLILGTLNPSPNVSVTSKDSRSEVIFNRPKKKIQRQWHVKARSVCLEPVTSLTFNQVQRTSIQSLLLLY